MIENILITGVNGFIGNLLAEALLSKGYRVIGLEQPACDLSRIRHILPKIKFYRLENERVGEIFQEQKIDGIVHLATYYRKQHSQSDITPMFRTNVELPSLLLDLGAAHGLKWFINTGTFFEYACPGGVVNEKSAVAPRNLYAATKTAFDDILKTYVRNENIKGLTLRLFSPYGPKDNPDKVIPYMIDAVLKNKVVRLSPSSQKLAFIYVADVVAAYVKAVKKTGALKKHEVVNIGGKDSCDVNEIVKTLEGIAGRKMQRDLSRPAPAINIAAVKADLRKAERLLAWRPRYDIRTGLKKTFEYYKSIYEV